MKRISLLLALLMLCCAVAVMAQEERRGSSGPFGQFREQHKYTFQLMRMVRGIGELEKAGKAPLTAAQAKGILAALTPLRKLDKLTQDQAKNALKAVQKQLTARQLTEIDKMKPERGRFSRTETGTSGGNSNSNARQTPPSGSQRPRPRFDMSRMKNFNPFSMKVDKSNPMSERNAKTMKDFFTALEKKAKAAK